MDNERVEDGQKRTDEDKEQDMKGTDAVVLVEATLFFLSTVISPVI